VRSLRASYVGDATNGPSVSAAVSHPVTATLSNGAAPPVSYKLPLSPQWIGHGDFNSDGKADIVTVSTGSGAGAGGAGRSIIVLLGNGDGTLRTASSYVASTNYSFSGAVIADFNLDGRPDIATGGDDGIVINRGNGDGTFAAPLQSGETAYASSLVSSDFDRDGKPDMAAVYGSAVVILFGKGDGTFHPRVAVTPPGVTVSGVKVGDMNGDGYPDLVTSNVSVMLGNGDGTFRSPITASMAADSTGFVVDDFNGDGKPDVALITWSGVFVLPGNGDGTLQPRMQSTTTTTPGYFMTSGDFNGDGKTDLGYAGYYNALFALELGKGDGTFQSGGYLTTDAYFSTMTSADLNGDGRPDYAVANSGSSTINVFLGGLFSGLTVSISHFGNFTAGETGVYNIVVRNPTFTSIAGAVTLTATLPAGLTGSTITADYPWNCVLATLTCTVNGLTANNAFSPRIVLTVAVSGAL
jgi:uncharacterized repeat protein (TIGR01451 family)